MLILGGAGDVILSMEEFCWWVVALDISRAIGGAAVVVAVVAAVVAVVVAVVAAVTGRGLETGVAFAASLPESINTFLIYNAPL